MNFLDAAYIVTWVIHGAYIAILVSRYRKVGKEIEDLKRK